MPATEEEIEKLRAEARRPFQYHAAGERCARCHRQAPNPNGCARCNPIQLGYRLHAAIGENETFRALLIEARVLVASIAGGYTSDDHKRRAEALFASLSKYLPPASEPF